MRVYNTVIFYGANGLWCVLYNPYITAVEVAGPKGLTSFPKIFERIIRDRTTLLFF